MRYSASEKLEIIRLVEDSELSARLCQYSVVYMDPRLKSTESRDGKWQTACIYSTSDGEIGVRQAPMKSAPFCLRTLSLSMYPSDLFRKRLNRAVIDQVCRYLVYGLLPACKTFLMRMTGTGLLSYIRPVDGVLCPWPR